MIDGGVEAAWMAGTRPAMTAEAGQSTGIAISAKFFIWIRCNPLKSPDSAKGIQGNASNFACFNLDLLAFICSSGGTRLNTP
jgi:hypothetical protein